MVGSGEEPFRQSEYSQVRKEEFGRKRRILESESERSSIVISVQASESQQREERIFSKEMGSRDRASRIEERIRQRELAFSKVNPMTCKKPSDKETMDFLKKMGIQSGFAKTSLVSGVARPTFSPNGQIAFVCGNKIRVVQTPHIEDKGTHFSPAEAVIKHTKVGKGLDDRKERAPISNELNLSTEFYGSNKLFKDSFFLQLLTRQIPSVSFCPDELGQAPQLSKFLTALAESMAKEKSEKVKHEFVAVCMLNALFGNPHLNLVQLHPAYEGP